MNFDRYQFVIPVYNSEATIRDVVAQTSAVLSNAGKTHEFSVQESLNHFAWVEYRPCKDPADPLKLATLGFVQVDTQVRFRLALRSVDLNASLAELAVRSAAEERFRFTRDDIRAFDHERFRFLPGATQERIRDRYALWANVLIESSPDTAMQISRNGNVEGWFLAEEMTPTTVRLTLAMAASASRVSGFHLYQRSMVEFAARGFRLGTASFSAGNVPVLNIYSRLGAIFVSADPCWLWIRPRAATA